MSALLDPKTHWETIYGTKEPHELSWFQAEASISLALIRRVVPELTAKIIDVGGGASTLVDGLVAAGYRGVTVLDLSPSALELARRRLGAAAHDVIWLEADASRPTSHEVSSTYGTIARSFISDVRG